jgi:hypothetical protein
MCELKNRANTKVSEMMPLDQNYVNNIVFATDKRGLSKD